MKSHASQSIIELDTAVLDNTIIAANATKCLHRHRRRRRHQHHQHHHQPPRNVISPRAILNSHHHHLVSCQFLSTRTLFIVSAVILFAFAQSIRPSLVPVRQSAAENVIVDWRNDSIEAAAEEITDLGNGDLDLDDIETLGDVCTETYPTSHEVSFNKSKDIVIGYLANFKGRGTRNRQGLIISGAISHAVDVVNRQGFPDGRRLRMACADTNGTSLGGTDAMLTLYAQRAVAFFGPEDMCQVEATVAAAVNLPMISYKCANPGVTNAHYPTFLRTHPSDAIVVRYLRTMLHHYSWCHLGILWMKTDSETVESFLDALRKNFGSGMCVDKRFFNIQFDESYDRTQTNSKYWSELVERTTQVTRVFLFIGESDQLIAFVLAMKTRGYLARGDYIIISLVYDEDSLGLTLHDRPRHEQQLIIEASRSLLFLVKKPNKETFAKFSREVRKKNKEAPFWLLDKRTNRGTHERHISAYAAYLYDAVMLYADALRQIMVEDGDTDWGQPELDGRRIVRKIIDKGWYESVTGARMTIDTTTGDIGGSYELFQISSSTTDADAAAAADGDDRHKLTMGLVGTFRVSDTITHFEPLANISWVRANHPPFDEPPCGFDGNKCVALSTHTYQIYASFVLGMTLMVVSFVALVVYRSWRYEQEIDGLLWMIHEGEVSFQDDGDGGLKGGFKASNYSLVSVNSMGRAHLRNSNIITGVYKGMAVVVKRFRLVSKSPNVKGLDLLDRLTKKDFKAMKAIHQKNINPFIGVFGRDDHPQTVFLVREFCGKGSLKDVLEKDEIKLDEDFLSSLVYDIIGALSYLHKSDLKCHGNLKSTNCLITSRWVLKVTDFGMHNLEALVDRDVDNDGQAGEGMDYNDDHDDHVERPPPPPPPKETNWYSLLWKAPEVLRAGYGVSPEADIYAFGIIIHEIIHRKGPFSMHELTGGVEERENEVSRQIIESVKNELASEPYRPDTDNIAANGEIIDIMKLCWLEEAHTRPTIEGIKTRFKACHSFRPPSGNLIDKMMKLMEQYQNQLEDLVVKRTQQLYDEKRKTETLLYRILPESVGRQLLIGNEVTPESFQAVTIFFSDIVGFTSLSAESTPMEVVTFLNDLYTLFDSILSYYDVYKVETIGDAYMVVSGLPERNGDRHYTEIASMALEMLESISNFQIRHRPYELLQLRIGIHQGPVVAGVVGLKMPRYCLFGDTVNTASRMESNGEALRIHISQEMQAALAPTGKYILIERGRVHLKGKGEVTTYWLEGHVDGPQPRLTADDYETILESRTRTQHVTLFQEEVFMAGRKGSFSGHDSGKVTTTHYFRKKANPLPPGAPMANSMLKLQSAFSNSCSVMSSKKHAAAAARPLKPTTSPEEPLHVHSPKQKRAWHLGYINSKFRSFSTHQPDTEASIPLQESSATPERLFHNNNNNNGNGNSNNNSRDGHLRTRLRN